MIIKKISFIFVKNNYMGLGGGEIFVILIIALLVFGSDKLPEIARGLGKTVREFKKVTSQLQNDLEKTDIGKDIKDISTEIKDVKKSFDLRDNDINKDIRDLDKNIKG